MPEGSSAPPPSVCYLPCPFTIQAAAAPQVRTLRRASLVHDLGRLGVSNSIWDKPGPLGAGEWEHVRLHPHLTERMLQQSEALAPLCAIAVQHRERLELSLGRIHHRLEIPEIRRVD